MLAFTPADNILRNYGDPVSNLDTGALTTLNVGINSHKYGVLDNNTVSSKPFSIFVYRTCE